MSEDKTLTFTHLFEVQTLFARQKTTRNHGKRNPGSNKWKKDLRRTAAACLLQAGHSRGKRHGVRLLPLLLLWLLSAVLHAQEQDRKMMDRLTKPNMELEYDTRKSSFGTASNFKTGKAASKEFGGARTFAAKEFSAKTFGGSKQSWFASMFFPAKGANTKGKYEVPNASTAVDVKSADVKDAREAGKTMETTSFAQTDQTYLRKGRSQSRFDLERGAPADGKPVGYSGDLRPMTIDDVRDLLNKNK